MCTECVCVCVSFSFFLSFSLSLSLSLSPYLRLHLSVPGLTHVPIYNFTTTTISITTRMWASALLPLHALKPNTTALPTYIYYYYYYYYRLDLFTMDMQFYLLMRKSAAGEDEMDM